MRSAAQAPLRAGAGRASTAAPTRRPARCSPPSSSRSMRPTRRSSASATSASRSTSTCRAQDPAQGRRHGRSCRSSPQRLDAHRLIEEFMILANVAAAETLERARVPLIYRVHDEPSPEKIEALREFLATLDISPRQGPGAARRATSTSILARVKGREYETLVNEVVLRSQAQAEYAAENYGHFGLEPAPLRALHLADPPLCRPDRASRADPRAELRRRRPAERHGRRGAERDRGAHLGRRAARHEGRARDHRPADRAFPRRPHRRHVRRAASAASPAPGCSSKLDETGADGFVPARTIGDDYFRYNEARHALIGDHTGETLPARRRASTVKLVEAAPVAGALRFELLSEGRYETGAKRRAAAGGSSVRSTAPNARAPRSA